MPALAVATTTNTANAAASPTSRPRDAGLLFVSARPVHRRQRHVLLAQVHAQLATMMDDVVHHERAPHRCLRHREDGVVALLQRPGGEELRVGLAEKGLAGAG